MRFLFPAVRDLVQDSLLTTKEDHGLNSPSHLTQTKETGQNICQEWFSRHWTSGSEGQ